MTTATESKTPSKSINVEITPEERSGLAKYSVKIAFVEKNSSAEQTILFIHGNSASKEFFASLLDQPRLQSYRLIAPDLPGHGESENFPEVLRKHFNADNNAIFANPKHFYTLPGYANLLLAFLRTLKIEPSKVHLFGWSLGGHIATDILATEPSVASLIITGATVETFKDIVAGFAALQKMKAPPMFDVSSVFDLIGYRKQFTGEQAKFFHTIAGCAPSAVTEAAGVRTDPDARHYAVHFGFNAHEHAAELKWLAEPTTTVRTHAAKVSIIQGLLDPIRIQGASKAQLLEWKVHFKELEGVHHAVFAEAPEATAVFIHESILRSQSGSA